MLTIEELDLAEKAAKKLQEAVKPFSIYSTEEEPKSIFRNFSELCSTGNAETIEKFLDKNKISNYEIGMAFHGACEDNLENAKWLYDNYKKPCNDYMKTTAFFLQGILYSNKIDTLLWLKSLNNPIFISHIDMLFRVLINERLTDCNEIKILYEHFFDRFEYLKFEYLKNKSSTA